MTTFQERLLQFIRHKKLTNNKFEMSCGLCNGAVKNIREGMTEKSIRKISQAYPELNTTWLITGEGNMLVGGGDHVSVTASTSGDNSNATAVFGVNMEAFHKMEEEIKSLRDLCKRQEKELDEAKSQNNWLREMLGRLIPSTSPANE